MIVHVDTIETSDNNTTRTTTFFTSLTDGTHGVIDNGSYYRCHSSNFSCKIYSDGKLNCHDYSNDEYCSAYTNGRLNCYTVSKS